MARAQGNCGMRNAECGIKAFNPAPRTPHPALRRGQSTLEYLLVGVAVLLAVLFGVKLIQPEVENRMTDAGGTIIKAGTELKTAVDF